ncbi:MAG: hypothetical protein JWN03_2200 [Nocardia sp.]|nr:hypothetical protein [Nocardia sp.]
MPPTASPRRCYNRCPAWFSGLVRWVLALFVLRVRASFVFLFSSFRVSATGPQPVDRAGTADPSPTAGGKPGTPPDVTSTAISGSARTRRPNTLFRRKQPRCTDFSRPRIPPKRAPHSPSPAPHSRCPCGTDLITVVPPRHPLCRSPAPRWFLCRNGRCTWVSCLGGRVGVAGGASKARDGRAGHVGRGTRFTFRLPSAVGGKLAVPAGSTGCGAVLENKTRKAKTHFGFRERQTCRQLMKRKQVLPGQQIADLIAQIQRGVMTWPATQRTTSRADRSCQPAEYPGSSPF